MATLIAVLSPWLSFILLGVGMSTLAILATARKRMEDDETLTFAEAVASVLVDIFFP
jgi:uncharacterized membrane protein